MAVCMDIFKLIEHKFKWIENIIKSKGDITKSYLFGDIFKYLEDMFKRIANMLKCIDFFDKYVYMCINILRKV